MSPQPIGDLNRVIVFCGDVEKCGAFYRDVLGLPSIDETKTPGEWWEFQAGPARLALHQAYDEKGKVTSPTGGIGNPHKIVFRVKDVKAARKDLLDRGVNMGKIMGDGNWEACDGPDPEGHRFQIANS